MGLVRPMRLQCLVYNSIRMVISAVVLLVIIGVIVTIVVVKKKKHGSSGYNYSLY